MTDHYTTLGIARTASADEIKQAYRRLASKHHPDRGGDTKTFQQIQSAYDVLSDQEKRADYDNPHSNLHFNNAAGQPHFNFNFAGDLNDFFRQSFGQGFSQRRPQSFVRLSLWIRLTDIITGGRRPVAVNTGQGSNTIEIEIPKGINDGDSVQYSGLAPGGGDLVVQFRIHPDPRWHRENLNLITEHDISIWDMILGGDLVVKTLPGDQITVKIPPRCQPKNLLRIRGKGIPDQQGQVGDLFVRMIPVIPDNIDPDLLHAIERYRS